MARSGVPVRSVSGRVLRTSGVRKKPPRSSGRRAQERHRQPRVAVAEREEHLGSDAEVHLAEWAIFMEPEEITISRFKTAPTVARNSSRAPCPRTPVLLATPRGPRRRHGRA